MGRHIITAGVFGVLAVGVVLAVHYGHPLIMRIAGWPQRYLRARGYEHELARHTAAGLRAELETYATVTIPRAEVAGAPPWPLAGPEWQSDLEREGLPLPGWADPAADRMSNFGPNSGSGGSDYHGGEGGPWLPPTGNGTGDGSHPGPGPADRPDPGPAPIILPPGWSQPELPFTDDPGDDPALDATWNRLVEAWGPGPDDMELALMANDRAELGIAPLPTRLATRFDAELAADVSEMIRDMNRDCANYLAGLRS